MQASRPDPPEFDPDPALRLERALCYTGDLPSTLAFVGSGAEFVAFPSNNVIVLMETPVMPEVVPHDEEVLQEGVEGRQRQRDGDGKGEFLPAPHEFLRGHTDTITHVQLCHAGHLLASAQGDPLGAAGEETRWHKQGALGGGEGKWVDPIRDGPGNGLRSSSIYIYKKLLSCFCCRPCVALDYRSAYKASQAVMTDSLDVTNTYSNCLKVKNYGCSTMPINALH